MDAAESQVTAVEREDVDKAFKTPFNSFTAGGSSSTERASGFATPPTTQLQPDFDTSLHDRHKPSSPAYSIAQLSFLPATQTTVVTTTTTTTLNCPPLVVKEPQNLEQLDPKVYPLASSPTPAFIRNFEFDVAGQKAAFQEADDPLMASQQLSRQRQALVENDGSIRSVKRVKTDTKPTDIWTRLTDTPPQNHSRQLAAAHMGMEKHRVNTPHAPRRHLSRTLSGHGGRSSRLQVVQTSTPITPSVVDNEEDGMRGEDATGTQDASPSYRPAQPSERRASITTEPMDLEAAVISVGSKTKTSEQTQRSTKSQGSDVRRPHALDTSNTQDVSLPSPSLSPVTAAASIGTRRGYFDHSQTLVSRSPPNEMADEADEEAATSKPRLLEEPSSLSISPRDTFPSISGSNSNSSSRGNTISLMDIPTMIESFDALPASVKSYVMFQFLRRCEKSVLQFVADNVNPALKCDFIALLPPELSEKVLGCLDTKSLCRAAQVSKKWRTVVDTSERTWKNQLTRDGFYVGTSELRRAITEGWGWQIGSSVLSEDWEKDISGTANIASTHSLVQPSSSYISNEDEMVTEVTLQEMQDIDESRERQHEQTDQDDRMSPLRRTSKRKQLPRSRVTSRKLQKRDEIKADEAPMYDTTALIKQVSAADGPFAVARVASMVVPSVSDPAAGGKSIQNMHLYKTLYRRSHMIDTYWMSTKLKPKHLAFKAHERHVVTCLHFDSERILTGSDDTNINVYDTKTGVQRNILRGHDGGVWALKCYGNTLVSGSTDRSVRVWDIEAGECTHIFHGHTSTVRCLVIVTPTVVGRHSDGRAIVLPREPLIITGSRDSSLRIWKLPQAKDREITMGMTAEEVEAHFFVRALTGHAHSVRAIAAHGDTLVSGSYDHTVRVWRVSTGAEVHTLRGHTQKVYSVVLDTQRNRCISGSMDNTVRIWSLVDGSQVYNLEGHNSLVGLLDLKGDRLVSAAADSTLRIWDPESGACKATLLAHTGAITCFQHDARKVISGSDRTLKMWDTKTGEFVRDLLTDLSGVWQVGFDGRRCVAAVQRESLTYIEILDFGAARDGIPESRRGVRIEVDQDGDEIVNTPGNDNGGMFMGLGEVPTGMM